MEISINPSNWKYVTKDGRLKGEIRIGRTTCDLLTPANKADDFLDFTGNVEVVASMTDREGHALMRPSLTIVENFTTVATYRAMKAEEEKKKK